MTYTTNYADRCALYMVLDTRSGAIKIGISKHPKKRLGEISRSYNVGNCQLLRTTWFATRNQAEHFEKSFHRKYQYKKSALQGGREWFNLSTSEAIGFAEWMERSSNQRAFRATTIQATVEVPPDELKSNRKSMFWASFFTGLLLGGPIAWMALKNPAGALIPSLGFGAFSAARVEKTKRISRTYGLDGKAVSTDLPKSELRQMGLWIEKTEEVGSTIAKDGKFPDVISDIYTRRIHGIDAEAS